MPFALDPAAIDVVTSEQVLVFGSVLFVSLTAGFFIDYLQQRRRHADRRQRALVDLYAYAERLRRHTEATRQADLFKPEGRRNG